MASFYAAVTKSQYPAALAGAAGGYVEIKDCQDSTEARVKISAVLGNKWSFLYPRREDMHELVRKWSVVIDREFSLEYTITAKTTAGALVLAAERFARVQPLTTEDLAIRVIQVVSR